MRTRLLRLLGEGPFLGRSLRIMGVSAVAVYGLGAYEASLLLQQGTGIDDSLFFVHRYASEQLLPSCIWETKPADLVAIAIGMEPSTVLHQFASTADDAVIQLRCLGLAAGRSVIAGFVCLAQVLRTLSWSLTTFQRYEERVQQGHETLFSGVPGRVLRLCGRTSDVTSLTLQHARSNVIPVFEQPAKVQDLICRHSDNFETPVFWQVSEGRYSAVDVWSGLTYQWSDFLTATATGKTLLYMEADATNYDQSLAIGKRSTDLKIEDASQAFRSFESAVRQGLEEAGHEDTRRLRPFRVILADLKQTVRSGGTTGDRTLRNRVEFRREADVLVDSQAPVLAAVLQWCHKACAQMTKDEARRKLELNAADGDDADVAPGSGGEGSDSAGGGGAAAGNDAAENDAADAAEHVPEHTQLLFNTTSAEYFLHIQKCMRIFGFEVLDADAWDQSSDPAMERRSKELPRLIYCSSTWESVNAAKSLIAAGNVDPKKCCVLLDDPAGLDSVQDLIDDSGHRFEAICSALIYDELLRRVRGWVKLGHSAEEIQNELDCRSAHIDAALCSRARAAQKE